MAYGAKYHVHDVSRKGNEFLLTIYKSGYGGSNTELKTLGPDFAVLSMEGEGDDLFEPIKATNLEFVLTGPAITMAALTAEIAGGATNDFIVILNKDMGAGLAFFWGGIITHEIVEIPDRSKYIVQLTAIDGLSTLNGKEWTTEEFNTASGSIGSVSASGLHVFFTPSAIVWTIIKQLPWITTAMPGGLVISWADDWSPEEYTSGEVWQNTIFIDIRVYATYNSRTSKYDLKNLYDILTDLLLRFFSEIKLANGLWMVTNKDYLREETRNLVAVYANTVAYTDTESDIVTIAQTDEKYRLAGGKIRYKQPVKRVRQKVIYNNNSTANNEQTIYDQYQTLQCSIIGGTNTNTGVITCEAVSSDDIAKFRIAYNLRVVASRNTPIDAFASIPSAFKFAFILKIVNGGTTYYLQGNEITGYSWTTTSTAVAYITTNLASQSSATFAGTTTITYDSYLDNTFDVVLPFTTGVTETTFQIIFSEAIYINNNLVWGSDPTYLYVYFNLGQFTIQPLNADNEETTGFVTFSAVSVNNNDFNIDLPDAVIHDGSDGSGLFYNNNIGSMAFVPGTISRTTKWYDKEVGDAVTYFISELFCRSYLDYIQTAMKLYSGTFRGKDLTPASQIKITFDTLTETYQWNGFKYSLHKDEWSGELWRVTAKAAPETMAVTTTQGPPLIEISRTPPSLPYKPGTTSGADDHIDLLSWLFEWKSQTKDQIFGSPAGSDGYPVFRRLSRADISQFGDGTNYSEFESDGTLKMIGLATVYKDIDFPLIIRTTGTGVPRMTTVQGNLQLPQFAVGDYLQCEAQELIHEWKEGSDMVFHVHIVTAVNDGTDRYVKLEIEYNYADIAGVWQGSNITVSSEFQIRASTTALTHLIKDIATISHALHIGGHIWARLKRVASSGTAPSVDPYIEMLQLHVECDTIGSRNITSK